MTFKETENMKARLATIEADSLKSNVKARRYALGSLLLLASANIFFPDLLDVSVKPFVEGLSLLAIILLASQEFSRPVNRN